MIRLKDVLSFKYNGGISGLSLKDQQPLVQYSDWTPATDTINSTRYITDESKKPKYSLALHSGRGMKFNGIDQRVYLGEDINYQDQSFSLLFTIRPDTLVTGSSRYIVTMQNSSNLRVYQFSDGNLKIAVGGVFYVLTPYTIGETNSIALVFDSNILTAYKDGVQVNQFNVNSFLVGIFSPIVNGNRVYNGLVKDLYGFNTALTQNDITKSYEQPEQFFIDALTDNTCVMNRPLNDADEFSRGYTDYDETNILFDGFSLPPIRGISSTVGDEQTITTGADISGSNYLYLRLSLTGSSGDLIEDPQAGDILKINLRFKTSQSAGKVTALGVTIWADEINEYKDVEITGVHNGSNTQFMSVTSPSIEGESTTIDKSSLRIVRLSGINEVENYTTSVNETAIPYGTQELKLPADGLGKRTGEITPWIKGDGVGYADTGYLPSPNTEVSFEAIFVHELDKASYMGRDGGISTSQIFIGSYGDGSIYTRFGTSSHVRNQATAGMHHIVMSVNALGSYDVYIDGDHKGNYPQSFTLGDSLRTMFVGASNNGSLEGSNHLNEETRLFKVHDKALTAKEVSDRYVEIYNNGDLEDLLYDEYGKFLVDDNDDRLITGTPTQIAVGADKEPIVLANGEYLIMGK